MKKTTPFVVCPRCGSTKVTHGILKTNLPHTPQEYLCEDCKYHGYLFPYIDKDKVKQFQK